MRQWGKIRRVVVKVGTNLLSLEGGVIDEKRIEDIARQIATMKAIRCCWSPAVPSAWGPGSWG